MREIFYMLTTFTFIIFIYSVVFNYLDISILSTLILVLECIIFKLKEMKQ